MRISRPSVSDPSRLASLLRHTFLVRLSHELVSAGHRPRPNVGSRFSWVAQRLRGICGHLVVDEDVALLKSTAAGEGHYCLRRWMVGTEPSVWSCVVRLLNSIVVFFVGKQCRFISSNCMCCLIFVWLSFEWKMNWIIEPLVKFNVIC